MRRTVGLAVLLALTLSACSAHLQGNPGRSQAKVQVNPAQVKIKAK